MYRNNYKLIAVSGLHRSGTTYLGNILNKSSSIFVLHEPFNYKQGLVGAPPFYSHSSENSASDNAIGVFADNVYNLRGKWHRVSGHGHILRMIGWRLFGSWPGFKWGILKLRASIRMMPPIVCWKDPFLTFLSPMLIRKFDADIVYVVRHPCALYLSQSKRNWFADIDEFMKQESLVAKYANDIDPKLMEKAREDSVLAVSILWKIMLRFVLDLKESGARVHLVKHEELCEFPEEVVRGVCDFIGIPFASEMEKYILRTTHGESPNSNMSMWREAYFVRNSKELMTDWKHRLSLSDQEKIVNICRAELELIGYGA